MKKEYHFTISRTDRIWLIVFVLLLLGWDLVKYILPAPPLLTDELMILDDNLDQQAPEKIIPRKEIYARSGNKKPSTNKWNEAYAGDATDPIVPVHIMGATTEELRSIGINFKVASNIKKYIAAGGVIKNEQDLMKIYGMDSAQFNVASPYILYPSNASDSISISLAKGNQNNYKNREILNLNEVTAAELESLPGIGPVLAERIIKLREGLGGFFRVDQLKDCYGLPPETFEKIQPSLAITTPPPGILINEIDLSTFFHPYLHKRFPKMIKAYKDQHGPFRNESDLRKVFPPDSNWCEKILPYIDFGKKEG